MSAPTAKISELPAASTLTGSELIPVVQDGVTKRSTLGTVAGLGNSTAVEITNTPHGDLTTTNVQASLDFLVDNLVEAGPGTDPLALTHGLDIDSANATIGSDASGRRAAEIDAFTDSSTSNPDFSNEEGLRVTLTAAHGQNTNGGAQQAKKTFLPINVAGVYNAAGQHFAFGTACYAYGMGDAALFANMRVQYAGGAINGDEGVGWNLVSILQQQPTLNRTSIASVPTQSTYTATLTQNITASQAEQTVTVSSTTGAVVGDWIVIGQHVATPEPTMEAVQIAAIGVGTITSTFFYNHATSDTIKPALVLNLNGGTSTMGQDRFLINLTKSSYSTGTVSAVVGFGYSGSGTSWANNMVGGNSLNIGMVSFAADDYTGTPFNNTNNRLRSWYSIKSVTNSTSLLIHTYSCAGDESYRGRGPDTGTYTIRQSAKVLRVVTNATGGYTNQVICEYSTSTWSAADEIEQVICPYPDVSGFQFHTHSYTNGGVYRSFMNILNQGPRKFEACFRVGSTVDRTDPMQDSLAYDYGMSLGGCGVGIFVDRPTLAAMQLSDRTGDGIYWGTQASDPNLSIRPTGSNGLRIRGTNSGGGGELIFYAASGGSASPRMDWDGYFKVSARAFSFLPAATSLTGSIAYVTDSTTAVPGAVVTGSGGSAVVAFSDGTNWRVLGGNASTVSKQIVIPLGTNAKLGGTGTGWVIGADDTISLLTLPAGQTSEIVVCAVNGLEVGDVITQVALVGQVESAGNNVTLNMDFRRMTAAAADITDASVSSGGPGTLTADTILSASNTGLNISETVAADEAFYAKITATTAAATDIALMNLLVTLTRAR